jgi:signal transduction histidine kinase
MEHSSTVNDPLETALSTIRHQLGNLVNALQLNLDVLQENFERYDDPRKLTLIDRIRSAVWQQRVLVDALKSYSAFGVTAPKALAFHPLWQALCNIAQQQATQRGISLKYPSGVTDELSVIGDKTAIKKVFACILGNAFEALEDVLNPVIALDVDMGEKDVTIQVQDNGPPAREPDASRWLAPLYSTKPDRMGMGLTIACKLLTQMGGGLDVDVSRQPGTTVSFTLRQTPLKNLEETVETDSNP